MKSMKCLLCSASFNNGERLREHYIGYHKIDKVTSFFKSFSNPLKEVPFFVNVLDVVTFYQPKILKLSMIF